MLPNQNRLHGHTSSLMTRRLKRPSRLVLERLEAKILLSGSDVSSDIGPSPTEPAAERRLQRIARRVQSLTYDEFPSLGPQEVSFLSPEQLASIPNSTWFSRIPSESRAALDQSQVRELDLGRLGLTHLSRSQRAEISVDQIKSLKYRFLGMLSEQQIRFVTPNQIASIPSARWFGAIRTEARENLGASQIQALNVRKLGIGALTVEQRSLLTPGQIQKLGYQFLRFLNHDQISHVTSDQIGSIPSVRWFRQFSDEAVESLTPDQIRSIKVHDIGLANLTGEQRSLLTVEQVRALRAGDFQYLSRAQVTRLTGSQLRSIPHNRAFGNIPRGARNGLRPGQIKQLNVEKVGIRHLTNVQRRQLTVDQIQSLGHRSFQHLRADQAVHLTKHQLGSIPNAGWFNAISSDVRTDLTTEQVQALNLRRVGLSGLSLDQVQALPSADVRKLGYRSFHKLAPNQIQFLTQRQLESIPNLWWFSRIPTESREALSVEQFQHVGIDDIPLRLLTGEQISSLSDSHRDHLQALESDVRDVEYYDFRNLNPEQVPHLSPLQISTIPHGWWFGQFNDEARAALTTDQIQALNVAEVGIEHLSNLQIQALTQNQIQSLDYHQFKYLSATETPHLSPQQMATIPNSWWFGRISHAARRVLDQGQVRALDVEAVGLEHLTSSQVGMISAAQIRDLSYSQFSRLSHHQSPHLTTDQLASIPNHWWFKRMTDHARHVLNMEQVQSLNVSELGLEQLSAHQVDWLTVDQIQSISYTGFRYLLPHQIQHVTVDQIAELDNNWWFGRMSEESRAELGPEQVRSLDVANVGIKYLTSDQVEYLTVEQIQSLGYWDFGHLSANQTIHLTNDQLASIRDSWWFSRISESGRAVLSVEQVQHIDTGIVSIKYLSGSQRSVLTVPQIQALHSYDFRFLNSDQTPHLTAEQLGSMHSYWTFQSMSEEARDALSRDQLFSLPHGIFNRAMGLNSEFTMHPDDDDHDHGSGSDGHNDGDHDDGLPHPDNPAKRQEHLALFDLVSHEDATHITIASGIWSDPNVWEHGAIPTENSRVVVSADNHVIFDAIYIDAMHTVRIDGTLDFAHDIDTQLKADTIVVDGGGVFRMGTDEQPINNGVAARVVIADTGPIDTTWDPLLLSRGFIAHGTTEVAGQAVTPYVALSVDPVEGDTQLVLDFEPENWKIGDRLVLTGTSSHKDHFQDEEFEIALIEGRVVTLDHALEYDHRTPEGHDLSVYVANMNRNAVFLSENVDDNARRGHVMFMHSPNVHVSNAGFYGLGRTDKRNPANDPVLDSEGQLIEDTGLNPRGRYAVHVHRSGVSGEKPAVITGSSVVDSPGWGFVNHDSFAQIEDNVAYHVVGASFVTEFGNEIGTFKRNLSMNTSGSGDGLESREDIFDFGHGGHGFWLQGPGVEVDDNISASNASAAFIFFTASSEAEFAAENLSDPSLAAGRDSIPVGTVPLSSVKGNVAFASATGLETWFHLTNVPDGESVIEDFTSWNTRGRGVHTPYTGRTTLRNITVIGNPDYPWGTGFSRNNVTNNIRYENVHVEGFGVGISVPVRKATVIDGGYFEAIRAIDIHRTHDTNRTVDIVGDPVFADIGTRELRGRDQHDIYLDGSIDMKNRDLETFFSPDIIRIGTVRLNGKQIYYHEQAANLVPFASHDAPSFIPPEILDKTNKELWDQYGIAPAGIVAPSDAIEMERINGLVGDPSTYLPELDLLSRKYTNVLNDYQLSYLNAAGDRFTDGELVDLREGWNLITRDIGGSPRTFFVFGDTEAPTFELSSETPLVVNPDGLEFGFVLRGTVFDNSFGHMSFRKKFNDLQSREIETRADGSQFIELEFTIHDLAGNVTAIRLELNLDPNAPLVPGTGQRDLPDRELPETLYELLEYYLITE